MHLAFFGSSLVSAYWNGAATYYRGVIKALHARGHRISFYEPDAYDRQQHRDIAGDPPYARSVVYENDPAAARRYLDEAASDADAVIKCSGVGVMDDLLADAVTKMTGPIRILWDVDAPATLQQMQDDPDDVLRDLVPAFDLVFTYGGGPPVIERYTSRGAQRCVPIYNAHDPDTHHPVEPAARFRGDLAFMGNRLPDREARVDAFFFRAAELLPDRNFLIGGSGWDDRPMPANVTYLGHVYTDDHNAMNATPLTVLNISRQSMADTGYSPATRVFEAAAAGACLITDAWTGLDQFLAPGSEVLAAADGDGVAHHLQTLTPERAQAIGRAAHERVLRNHTYASRAAEVEAVLRNS